MSVKLTYGPQVFNLPDDVDVEELCGDISAALAGVAATSWVEVRAAGGVVHRVFVTAGVPIWVSRDDRHLAGDGFVG